MLQPAPTDVACKLSVPAPLKRNTRRVFILTKRMNSILSAAGLFVGLSLLSVPAAAQRGGGAPQPEGCPGPPQWQLDRNAAAAAARVALGKQAEEHRQREHWLVAADEAHEVEPRLSCRQSHGSPTSPRTAFKPASPTSAVWPRASGTSLTSSICRSTLMTKRAANTSIRRSSPLPRRCGNSGN